MPWWQAAGAVGGAAINEIFGDDPPKRRPALEAQISYNANNPNLTTPFGGVRYRIDDMGTPDKREDDRYYQEQYMSPGMEALANQYLAMAGAAPATFQSAPMPTGLAEKMQGVLGDFSMPTYDRGDYGFGGSRDPVQVGNLADAGLTESTGPRASNVLEGFTPGETTNRELVGLARDRLAPIDYNLLTRHLNTNDGVDRGNSLYWGADPGNLQTQGTQPGLSSEFQRSLDRLWQAVYDYDEGWG